MHVCSFDAVLSHWWRVFPPIRSESGWTLPTSDIRCRHVVCRYCVRQRLTGLRRLFLDAVHWRGRLVPCSTHVAGRRRRFPSVAVDEACQCRVWPPFLAVDAWLPRRHWLGRPLRRLTCASWCDVDVVKCYVSCERVETVRVSHSVILFVWITDCLSVSLSFCLSVSARSAVLLFAILLF